MQNNQNFEFNFRIFRKKLSFIQQKMWCCLEDLKADSIVTRFEEFRKNSMYQWVVINWKIVNGSMQRSKYTARCKLVNKHVVFGHLSTVYIDVKYVFEPRMTFFVTLGLCSLSLRFIHYIPDVFKATRHKRPWVKKR